MNTKIGMVESSNGRFVIDLRDGKVLNRFPNDPESTVDFDSIVKFDLNEWRKRYPFDQHIDSFDILDLGFWDDQDDYHAPDHNFRYQSHWDHVYELKQMLIDEVILHLKEDFNCQEEDAMTELLNQLPIPNLYHYLPEHHLHEEKFKYLIDKELTHFANQHKDHNDYYGLICPQCRTPLDEFDDSQMECCKCNIIINWKPKEE